MLGDRRPLRIWGWLLLAMLATEALLHTPLGDRIPEAPRWGNAKLAQLVDDATTYASEGPVDVVVFGSSQGALWIDEADLRASGLRVVNASLPGGNMKMADLLGSRLFLPSMRPKLVVISVGPMSLAHWNEHFVSLVEGSPVGGPILRGEEVRIWLNQHVMLLRKGGQTLSAGTVQRWRSSLTGRPVPAEPQEDAAASSNLPRQLALFQSYQRDPAQFEALEHLKQSAEALGARVVFANLPVQSPVKQGATWNYADYLQEVERAVGDHPLLNLDKIATDSDFGDYVHPSSSGRQTMRPIVREFIVRQLAEASSK